MCTASPRSTLSFPGQKNSRYFTRRQMADSFVCGHTGSDWDTTVLGVTKLYLLLRSGQDQETFVIKTASGLNSAPSISYEHINDVTSFTHQVPNLTVCHGLFIQLNSLLYESRMTCFCNMTCTAGCFYHC